MRRFSSSSLAMTFPKFLTIVIGLSLVYTLVRTGFRSIDEWSSSVDKGVSVSRRIELASYRPQIPDTPVPAIQTPEPIGPVPPVDPNAPTAKPRRTGMEVPKLQMTQDNGRSTIVQDLAGDKSCAECHPGEHALHFGSGHARTLRPAGRHPVMRNLTDKLFRDEENVKLLWRYVIDGDRVEALVHEPGQPVRCVPLEWAVGSGEHGMTFMSILFDPSIGQYKGLEHRLSYLADGQQMIVTPGQAKRDVAGTSVSMNETGRVLDRKGLVKCLECHSTVTSDKNPGEFDPHTIVPNISCERCHGPGRAHIEAARQGLDESKLKMPLGPDVATPLRQIHECGTCHRRINTVPPSQLHEDNHELARFQPVGIEASLCFKEGRSGLKCTTCHDPHGKVSRDRPSYIRACMNCHEGPGKSECRVEPKGDCISCHMPQRTVSEVFRFTDHWIRIPKTD